MRSSARRVLLCSVLASIGLSACGASTTNGHPVAVPASPRTSGGSSSAAAPSCGSGACLTNAGSVAAVAAAAKAAIVAASSYDYRSLPAARARTAPLLTGAYLQQYLSAFDKIVTPNAVGLGAVQTATVDDVGVSSVQGTAATAVVAGHIVITQRGSAPRTDTVAASVQLTLVGSRWLLNDVVTAGRYQAHALGSPALASAVTAATQEVTDLLTLRRASFDADYTKAVTGATGSLRTDIAGKRALTKAALAKGGFDLTGTVTGSGVATVESGSVVLLILADSVRSTTPAAPDHQVLRVTVTGSGSRWLATVVQSVA